MEFGKIELSYEEKRLYDDFNTEIIELGKRMPESLQNLTIIWKVIFLDSASSGRRGFLLRQYLFSVCTERNLCSN